MSAQPTAAPGSAPPPIPPAKPVVLSSPGAYMANFAGSAPTATVHGVNKQQMHSEKPAIAARPIPPPTLPKYSASFGKVDRDRNEFVGKLDRVEREKASTFFIIILCFNSFV